MHELIGKLTAIHHQHGLTTPTTCDWRCHWVIWVHYRQFWETLPDCWDCFKLPLHISWWAEDFDIKKSLNSLVSVGCQTLTAEIFMRRERRRLQARHIWKKIEPNWPMIEERVWTKQATDLPYALYWRLFPHEYTEESRWLENSYKRPPSHWIQQQWKRCRAWFTVQAAAQSPSQWLSTLYLHRLDQIDALSWQWIDHHENPVEQVWHTQRVFRRKRPPDVRLGKGETRSYKIPVLNDP